ncbi:alpha/beta hydrolase [Actinospica robiniae]|uniref:alpha/beta hydrolase n=1 Tax=Actinospica robiniae TaxID=304901 RepID=UPI0004265685|nr:alpha/beta hydrolase-fold protein [Actinospica robiniae]
MGLTSEGFLIVVIAAVALFPLLTLLLWNRLPGPRPVKVGSRLGLILMAQVSAVLLAALWINNSYQLYTSWSDLFGRDGGTGAIAAATPADRPGVRSASLPNARLFRPMSGVADGYSATISGPRSHIVNNVSVWLPPQYFETAYEHAEFPVVQLLSGTPGSPQTWLEGMQAPLALTRLVDSGRAHPFILVSAAINVDPGHDPDCSNIPNGPKVATWLTSDVRDLVLTSFRASSNRDSWGLMGYSEGGLCASKLALQYPRLYSAAVSLSGDDHPDGDLLKPGTAAYEQNAPLWLLQHKEPAHVSLLLTGTHQDGDVAAEAAAMAAAAHEPTTVQTLMAARGGHNMGVWKADETPAFEWLSGRLLAPSSLVYAAGPQLISGIG